MVFPFFSIGACGVQVPGTCRQRAAAVAVLPPCPRPAACVPGRAQLKLTWLLAPCPPLLRAAKQDGSEPRDLRVPFVRPVEDEREARSALTMMAQVCFRCCFLQAARHPLLCSLISVYGGVVNSSLRY